MEDLFNIKQAAFILKVHPLTVRRYIREKKLKAIKAGGNVRIKEKDLLEFQKEFTPYSHSTKRPKININAAKFFNSDDPFFRLAGRGAGIDLTK